MRETRLPTPDVFSKLHLHTADESQWGRDRQELVVERTALAGVAHEAADGDDDVQVAAAGWPIGQGLADLEIEAAVGGREAFPG